MTGRIYTHHEFVSGAHVGPHGRAHLDSVAGWLQAAAFADGLDAGLGTGGGWIVRRTSIRLGRLPRFSERLTLRTWCGGLAASVAERRTTIEGDRGGLLEVESIWVHIDPETRQPTRFGPEFLAAYAESAGPGRPRTKLRHPPPPADAARREWQFTAADVDLAGHVNNAVYWRLAEEYLLGEGDPADRTLLEAEYRTGVGPGPAEVALAADRSLAWVLDAGAGVAASLLISRD